jgi:hypothetical protein
MSTHHEEFPELTQQTQASYRAGCQAGPFSPTLPTNTDRRYLAAFLREAIVQATEHGCILCVNNLLAIADNLHSPPPLPPTLAQAREADLDTPAGRDVVRDFLATLGEGVQA